MALNYYPEVKKKGFKYLTQEQVDMFMEKGYCILRDAVPKETIERYKKNVWVRLGMDENDKSTWTREKIHMGRHIHEHCKEVAPKVWGAICELLGGEDRVEVKHGNWGNGFIANLGSSDIDPNGNQDPRTFEDWHVDGDWFRHYLDSECQALETLVLWSDVDERGGPTYLCPDGMKHVAEYFLKHPEGDDTMQNEKGERLPAVWARECNDFVKLTGKTGDVFLAHQMMPHSRSPNYSGKERFITNPEISLNAPQNFDRPNPEDYSLLELKTLKVLGLDHLNFKITRPRKRFYPRTQDRMVAECKRELKFLDEWSKKTGESYETINKDGQVKWVYEFRYEGYDNEGNRLVPYPWRATPEEVSKFEAMKGGAGGIKKVGPDAEILTPEALAAAKAQAVY